MIVIKCLRLTLMSIYSLIVGAIVVGQSAEKLMVVVDRRQSVTVPFPNAKRVETEYCLLHAKFCIGTVLVAHDTKSLENTFDSVSISTTTMENFKLVSVFVLHVNLISEIALIVSSTSAIL